MRIYDITGLVPVYIKPEVSLTAWAANPQLAAASAPTCPAGYRAKLAALCNLSLYDGVSTVHRPGEPTGTIIEDGKQVHDNGNGFGAGIVGGKLEFGKPWDGRKWEYYATAFTACVIDGAYVPPSFYSAVLSTAQNRIALGRMKDGRDVIAVEDRVTLRQLSERFIAFGGAILCNYDGGASRHLLHGGKTICKSARVPYNALAFYSVRGKFEECDIYGSCVGCCGREGDDGCAICPRADVFAQRVRDILKEEHR